VPAAQNKPLPEEIVNCRRYFQASLAPCRPRGARRLGAIGHNAAVSRRRGRISEHKFGHLAEHRLPTSLTLIDS
jgi:uracil-DNA glycosylase